MIEICALASGSNGNCYYIGNENEAVLVDIGISNRQLSKRLKTTGLSLEKIKAIFISHEHADHVQGMQVVKKHNNHIEMYATKKTYKHIRNGYKTDNVNYFVAGDMVDLGNIKVHSFAKKHDAKDPVSFRIEINDYNIGVLTDLGDFSNEIIEHMNMCDAIFLESNYEHNLLMSGKYPNYLKQRVASDKGHLSNEQAVKLIKSLENKKLQMILLSHISNDNNSLDLASKSFAELAEHYKIILTSRFAPTKVYTIN